MTILWFLAGLTNKFSPWHKIMFYFYLFIILLFPLTFLYGFFRGGAPWVPMWSSDVKRLIKLAEVKSGQKVYDLGCGDGRVLFAAVKIGAIGEGYEISLLPFLLAQARRFFIKMKNQKLYKIKFKDYWFSNLSNADVVYFFQMRDTNLKLRLKLEKELKPGAKVIAYVWPIKGWEPVKIDKLAGKPDLYLYER